MRGYLTKHIPPTFSFTKTRKRRYFVLADRFLYAFKTDQPQARYREFLELTAETQAFVTDHLNGVLYCIEVRKPSLESNPWYLQADDAASMKVWLERIKKTIQYMADHPNDPTAIQKDKLALLLSDDLLTNGDNNSLHGSSSSSSVNGHVSTPTPRSSQPEIDTSLWRQSDATHWSGSSDPSSTLSSNGMYTSPPMSPVAMCHSFTAPSLRSPTTMLPPDGEYYAQQQLQSTSPPPFTKSPPPPLPLQQPTYFPTPHHSTPTHSRPGSIRSYSRLPAELPPALPPPTSSLPPVPPM
ncbi:hypothetical protein DM01DRAFT_1330863 [Hesseltinella vesiculosa]|uniref:PH domain-containing protein n=1 Tax=Hesseltinella vesiculosa TaxID=101127 RepID=A0A1X2GXI3_9FUNG|nr:hypothetical protein DM01DRAFT_1330863 [Hesseltinella vesiculosa]